MAIQSRNYLRNNDTGAEYDFESAPASNTPALDYSSPIEIGGVGKGYRVKGDPSTVYLSDGRRVNLGVDMNATRQLQTQQLATQGKMYDNQHKALQNQLLAATLRGGDDTMTDTPSGVLPAQMGVPAAPPDPMGGMSRKEREKLQSKMYVANDKHLNSIEQEARNAGEFAQDAQRFQQLNANTATGPVVGSTPVAWLRKALGSGDLQEMDAITAKLVPKMRQPGSGSTSDFDARMFQRGTIGVDKDQSVNDAIANGFIAKGQLDKDRAEFLRTYLEANGSLRGADSNWAKYVNSNPIFDPSNPEMPTLNKRRTNWRQFFSGEQQAPATPGGRPPLNSFMGR